MDKPAPDRQRRRYVLATNEEYSIYLRNFLLIPHQARRLDRYDSLHGRSPDAVEVVVLPGGKSQSHPSLLMALEDWKRRWGGLGLEYVEEEELLGGIPARKVRLLRDYDRKLETVTSSYLSQEVVRDWLIRLSPQDQDLLLMAMNERKTAKKAGEKKTKRPLA